VLTLGYLGGEIEAALGDGSMYACMSNTSMNRKNWDSRRSKERRRLFEGEPFM